MRNQASPFHLWEVIRSISFFEWDICSSLSSSVADCLFCRFTDPSKSSVMGPGFLNRFTATGFLISFQLHLFGFVEVRRGPLDCQSSIGLPHRAFFLWNLMTGDFPGLCKRTTARNHPPPCVVWNNMVFPVVHTSLFPSKTPTFVGTGELVLLRVGRRWYLLGWI